MAFVALNGFDVEHASNLLVYQNLFPEIQHIDGMGCTDTWTIADDITDITYIDIMRVLPYPVRFRQLGATNNGAWHNANNISGVNNAPQSTKYTVPIDLIYDEGVPIMGTQNFSNPVSLQQIVMQQVIRIMALTINVITFAKQIQAFFGDSFADPANPTTAEIQKAVFGYTRTLAPDQDGSAVDAFIGANAILTEGVLELGAMHIPLEQRQAFITPDFNRITKRQYMMNASEASAQILANGFLNPFTRSEGKRINSATGAAGMYDGVLLFLYNTVARMHVNAVLVLPANSTNPTVQAAITALNKIGAFIVYGLGTCRGIAFQKVQANPHPFQANAVYIVPFMKLGVKVLNGKSIKMIVEGGWSATEITTIAQNINFTPIDGVAVKVEDIFGTFTDADGTQRPVFNDGSSN